MIPDPLTPKPLGPRSPHTETIGSQIPSPKITGPQVPSPRNHWIPRFLHLQVISPDPPASAITSPTISPTPPFQLCLGGGGTKSALTDPRSPKPQSGGPRDLERIMPGSPQAQRVLKTHPLGAETDSCRHPSIHTPAPAHTEPRDPSPSPPPALNPECSDPEMRS